MLNAYAAMYRATPSDSLFAAIRRLIAPAYRRVRRLAVLRLREDAEAAADLGLLKALDRYDPVRGDFDRFAYRYVVGEALRLLAAEPSTLPLEVDPARPEAEGGDQEDYELGLDELIRARAAGFGVGELRRRYGWSRDQARRVVRLVDAVREAA